MTGFGIRTAVPLVLAAAAVALVATAAFLAALIGTASGAETRQGSGEELLEAVELHLCEAHPATRPEIELAAQARLGSSVRDAAGNGQERPEADE